MKSIIINRDAAGNATGATVIEAGDAGSGDENNDPLSRLEKMISCWNEFVRANGPSGATARITAAHERAADVERRFNIMFKTPAIAGKSDAQKRKAMGSSDAGEIWKMFDAVLTRIEELEERRGLNFRGIWAGASVEYECDDAVVANGSLWICHRDAPGRPGDAGSGWVLAVKNGEAK